MQISDAEQEVAAVLLPALTSTTQIVRCVKID
jgi:hypothetical protein